MKQTSLFRSWIKPSSSLNLSSSNSNKDASSHEPNFDPSDDIDNILGNVLDQLDKQDDCELERQKFIQSALSRRISRLSYHPTANDDNHLDEFDMEAGQTWLYPCDSDLRWYQLNMTEHCLFKNTLICLPTGLGKTFIAAVVMHNVLRWYPTSKVVFMAPTKPLVTQQLSACRQFVGARNNHDDASSMMMIELTGSINQAKRKLLWSQYRIIFLTPHTLVNDLQSGICPARSIRLVVVDEAHKATGNHVYCQVIRLLTSEPYVHRQFRVIALSATPASDMEGVQNVIANLLISHLELRTETSDDVKAYMQDKRLETVVVQLGPELDTYRNQLIACLEDPLNRLVQFGALSLSPKEIQTPDQCLAKFGIVKAREQWISKSNPVHLSSSEMSTIQNDFGLVICLLHALELLIQHGLRPVYRYLEGIFNGQRASPAVRAQLNRVPAVRQLHCDLIRRFDDAITPATQSPFLAGHPKLEKLKSILVGHFESHVDNSTRAIVFSQFRDSVEEIMHMLKQLRPVVRPASLIGQNSKASTQCTGSPQTNAGQGGITQRDQIRVMDGFRSGAFNTLVSTCVGEEGIDVGQVDLIVCFDAYKSPIRLVQRLGRTGRKRFGHIIMLLAEGREQRNYAVSMARTSSIQKALLHGSAYRKLAFYPHNPRMVPIGIEPQLQFVPLKLMTPKLDNDATRIDEKFIKPKNAKRSRLNDKQQLKTHVESIGLMQCQLRSTAPKRLMVSPMNRPDPQWPCLTEIYNPSNLTANLVNIQGSNASFSTRHLVSIFRMIRLHHQNQTVLSFHALGLRTVDVDTPWTEASEEIQEEKCNKPSQIKDKIQPIDTSPSIPTSVQSQAIENRPLHLVKGPVSKSIFFNPCPLQLYEFVSPTYERPAITVEALQTSWNKLLGTCTESPPTTNANCSISDLDQLDPSNVNLKLNIDQSLWEVLEHDEIVNEFQENENPHSSAMNKNSIGVKVETGSSTPDPKQCVFQSPKVVNKMLQPTYLNLNDALAFLDKSSIRLDTSALLSDEDYDLEVANSTPMKNAQNKTNTQTSLAFGGEDCCFKTPANKVENIQTSVVFDSNPNIPFISPLDHQTSIDLFSFDTKLSVGEDLEEFIIPTQHMNQSIHNVPNNNFQLDQSNDSLDSQINWSPINNNNLFLDDDDFFQTDLRHTSSPIGNFKSKATSYYSKSPSLQTSAERSGHTSNNIVQVKQRKSKKCLSFFMTQAQCDDEDDDFQDNCCQEKYDSSFIDDQTETTYDENASKSKINASDMMGIYLQTVRSPQFQNRWIKHEAKSNYVKESSSPEFVEDIAFEEPNEDYELDSFCVADDQSLSFEEKDTESQLITIKSKKRRRIITGSQIS